MNKYIVTLTDKTKVEVPTDLSIKDFKMSLIAQRIAFKSIVDPSAVVQSSSNRWDRKEFTTMPEAVAYGKAQGRGTIKAQNGQFVWYALRG